ncbi:hypothetical protein CK203_026368 [Vitis vinifera]|uniref:Reverse transcriptase/retrotransposon-derived protein RNase H-like domain-containing protein n=1 Tax=Vitis vinifera TaxID=29760 RepID=A0A438IW24_VITVI|nr:hypothetical protein CK203_105018 [Vitis vinifera]RVX00927.1 hypothetical protein CK203_026368 [Vitis vinifera]
MLQGAKISGWMNECEHAFEAIKRYLVEPPILSNLEAGEELYMYLAVLDLAINSILFQHNQSNEQRPIYYMSKALIDRINCIEDHMERQHEEMMAYLRSMFPPPSLPPQP